MTEAPERQPTSRLHTLPASDPARVSPAIMGGELTTGIRIRPIRYRYVMANVRTGKVIAVIPMTSVTYSVGLYSGQELSGTVYLPDMYLDQMVHAPMYRYARWQHFDTGSPVGAMFEVGNVAIYVMRNEEVVWGGILWSRAYSSGEKTMAITAMSWEAYIYYRVIRKTVYFPTNNTSRYTIWRGLLAQVLATGGAGSDFGWTGDDGKYANAGNKLADAEYGKPWTGLLGQGPLSTYGQYWPYNSPPIELPPAGLADGLTGTTIKESWQGFQLDNVGTQLEQFANINNMITGNGFEYRVLCWWDGSKEEFHQRYSFGRMKYDPRDPAHPNYDDYTRTPIGIQDPLFGQKRADADKTVFDFPGHISQWSLSESMENAATRIIVTGGSEDTKIAAYAADGEVLRGSTGDGKNGWLLYDKVFNYDVSKYKDDQAGTGIESRADKLLSMHHVPMAAQINDIAKANSSSKTKQRASQRSTELSITLYQDPTTRFPPWGIGDWVTFAIDDPLYGKGSATTGKMYLKRRIVKYTVTVLPDHESDFSTEQIQLELTDDTKIEAGG